MARSFLGVGMATLAECKNMKLKVKVAVLVFVMGSASPVFAQDSGYAALGRAIGTLLGNLFSGKSEASGQGPAFNDAPKESLDSSAPILPLDQPTPESMSAFKSIEDMSMARQANLCQDEKYRVFFSKSPCDTSEITITNVADKTKATPSQKKAIEALDVEYLEILKMRAENYRNNIKPAALGANLANLIMQLRTDSQTLLMNLHQEKITWGQFNEGRRDLISAFKKNFDAIIAPR